MGIPEQLRLLPSIARINGRLPPRILRAIAAMESNHPDEPHYYLPFVGVKEEGNAGAGHCADAPGSGPLRRREGPGVP